MTSPNLGKGLRIGVNASLFADQDWKAVGARIEELRGSITQQELAEEFGIHRNTLARYEAGGRAPDGEILFAICRRFGASPAWLLFGIPPREAPTTPEAATRTNVVDVFVLRQLVFAAALETERLVTERGLILSGERKASLISAVFELYSSAKGKSELEAGVSQLVDAFSRIPNVGEPD